MGDNRALDGFLLFLKVLDLLQSATSSQLDLQMSEGKSWVDNYGVSQEMMFNVDLWLITPPYDMKWFCTHQIGTLTNHVISISVIGFRWFPEAVRSRLGPPAEHRGTAEVVTSAVTPSARALTSNTSAGPVGRFPGAHAGGRCSYRCPRFVTHGGWPPERR